MMTLVENPPPQTTYNVLETRLFGAISLDGANVVTFERGLLGLPAFRRWLFIEGDSPATAWLQSADHPSLAFALVDPFTMFPEFTLTIDAFTLRMLGAAHASDVRVCALVTLSSGADAPTANLQGPLLIHMTSGRATQLVVSDSVFGVRSELPASFTIARPSTAAVK